MLTFKLMKLEDGYYHYEIYPEGKEENKGWIIFNPETKKIREKVEPNSPFDCITHFFSRLER